MNIPFWHFAVSTCVANLHHTPVGCFVGASAKNLAAAIGGGDAKGDESGSGAAEGASGLAAHLDLVVMVVGLIAALTAGVSIGVLARRELRKLEAAGGGSE